MLSDDFRGYALALLTPRGADPAFRHQVALAMLDRVLELAEWERSTGPTGALGPLPPDVADLAMERRRRVRAAGRIG